MFLITFPSVAQKVSNVRFEQVGKTINIYYDLSEQADINIFLSIDGGRTFESQPLQNVSGAVGRDVSEGRNRMVVWDVLASREKLQGDHICFEVKASGGQPYTETAYGLNLRMVYVEGGTFTMGCTGEQGGECENDESPSRQTTVGSFYMGMLEVTQGQWEKVMGTTIYQQRDKANSSWPIRGAGPDYPMYYVSWEEAKEFCMRLSRQTGRTYRLPTEAEWEYAARGGKRAEGSKYSGGWSVGDVAWYLDNSGNSTHVCGTKRANVLGLYDMSGNVWEWCEDFYGPYLSYDTDNPRGASSGSRRVDRGGGWNSDAKYCRVSNRHCNTPSDRGRNLGFRVVMVP